MNSTESVHLLLPVFRMRSTLLTRGILGFCAVIGCLLSTSANQETTGSIFKPCDSGQQSQPHVTGPTEFVRLSMAEANSVTRMRRSIVGAGRVRAGGPVPLLVYSANDNNNNGDVDGRPYSRLTRNFMRFGRNPPTGNDVDIVCLPVAAADDDEGPDMTSADEMFKDGDEKRFSPRLRRDQAQYDYNGKPFMRFGKRFARMVGRSPEVIGSRDGDVVCFRAIVDGGASEKGKRFMRFGRALTPDPHDDIQSQKEDGVTDSGEEKQPVLRFGKSPFPPGMRSAAEYEKQDDQSKM